MTVSTLPQTTTATLDGNEAVARVAYALTPTNTWGKCSLKKIQTGDCRDRQIG